jgi:hypothetical protein
MGVGSDEAVRLATAFVNAHGYRVVPSFDGVGLAGRSPPCQAGHRSVDRRRVGGPLRQAAPARGRVRVPRRHVRGGPP